MCLSVLALAGEWEGFAQMAANLPKNGKEKATREIADWRLHSCRSLGGEHPFLPIVQTAQVWSTLRLSLYSLMEGWQPVAKAARCVKPSFDLQLLSCLYPFARSLMIKARPKDCTLFSCVLTERCIASFAIAQTLTATFESHLRWQKVSIACFCVSHQLHSPSIE